jgi:hypothetical protein
LEISQDGDRVHLVAVDDHPFRTGGDLALTPDPEEVRIVRCSREVWVPIAWLVVELRTGTVPEDALQRIREAQVAWAAGTTESRWAEEETATDPEFRDWQELLDRAVEALTTRPSVAPAPPPPRPAASALFPSPWLAAAAALFATALGLGIWIAQLRGVVADLSQPIILPSSTLPDLRLEDTQRTLDLRIQPGADHLAVYLLLTDVAPYPGYRLELLSEAAPGDLWRSGSLSGDDEFLLLVRRSRLKSGAYLVRLYGEAEDGTLTLLASQSVSIEIP